MTQLATANAPIDTQRLRQTMTPAHEPAGGLPALVAGVSLLCLYRARNCAESVLRLSPAQGPRSGIFGKGEPTVRMSDAGGFLRCRRRRGAYERRAGRASGAQAARAGRGYGLVAHIRPQQRHLRTHPRHRRAEPAACGLHPYRVADRHERPEELAFRSPFLPRVRRDCSMRCERNFPKPNCSGGRGST